jgi:hypothetical protein
VAVYTARLSAIRVAVNFSALEVLSSQSSAARDTFTLIMRGLLAAWEEIKVGSRTYPAFLYMHSHRPKRQCSAIRQYTAEIYLMYRV